MRRLVLLAAILMATVSLVERSAAQNTINVTTTLQGITDASHCSLQEAIYSAEFGDSVAIGSTDPDATYTSGCAAGSGNSDTIVLQSGATYQFSQISAADYC